MKLIARIKRLRYVFVKKLSGIEETDDMLILTFEDMGTGKECKHRMSKRLLLSLRNVLDKTETKDNG